VRTSPAALPGSFQRFDGRGLLIERLARLCDEPGVFHRDDRLRGEILQQRDLPFWRRGAFSSIASNTGASSPGEELMTCNTSAVAVCCASASSRSAVRSSSRCSNSSIGALEIGNDLPGIGCRVVGHRPRSRTQSGDPIDLIIR
jgi:hypothetical protein